jgi:hypothetical protein
MGSGKSYKYSGTMPKSQPYARSYHATPEMIKYDRKRVYITGLMK